MTPGPQSAIPTAPRRSPAQVARSLCIAAIVFATLALAVFAIQLQLRGAHTDVQRGFADSCSATNANALASAGVDVQPNNRC